MKPTGAPNSSTPPCTPGNEPKRMSIRYNDHRARTWVRQSPPAQGHQQEIIMPVNCSQCGELIHSEEGTENPDLRIPCPKCGSKTRSIGRAAQNGLGVSDKAIAVVIPYPRILLAS